MKDCRDVEPLLAPYVDGDVPLEDRAALDAHFDACAPCRSDLEAQRAARELLRARRAAIRVPAPPALRARCAATAPPQVLVPVQNRTRLIRRLPLAAAATILLALGAVVGFGLNDKVQALAFQMTIDHVKCARFNSAPSAVDPIRAGEQWASKFGWPLSVPASSQPAGLELRGVRRCGVTDGRVAHLIYDWRGEPLSVYVLPSKVIDSNAHTQRFGHDSVMWSQNGRTYVVLADTSRRDDLAGVVQYMRSRLY